MIYTNVTVKVNNNGTATSNSKVVLYRGDREVEIQITLAGNPFIIQDSTFAQLIIKRPEASPVITGIAPLRDNKVILTITEQNIDELTEVGSYAYQVRLYDDDMSSRITLPPVENGLEVREPIVDEASGQIGRAMVGYSLVSRAYALEDNTTFNEYEEYNRTYWADGDFITEGKMNKIEDALEVINRKVLSSAESAYVSTNMREDQMVGIGESLDITFEFVSPNMGRGTMKVVVDGVQKLSEYIEQGENTVHLPEEFFKKGVNKVSIYVIDRAGKTSNELIFLVRYGSTEIIPDFDPYTIYQYGASVRYYFTPSALDTSLALTFYMVIDGEVKPGIECYSDVRGYYTFPNNLSVGAHFCQAYLIDGNGNKSNEVQFNLIILDAYSIAIASDTRNPVLEEGSQLVLDYRVYMQYMEVFKTKVFINEELVSEGECGLETAYYRTSSLPVGTHTIKIEAWDLDETVSDYVVWTVVVTPSTFVKLEAATAGSVFRGTAIDRSNSDADRGVWTGLDQDGNKITAELKDFSFNNESGWVDNELIFNGVSSTTIPIAPLADNARYGFTLDIEFTSRMVGVENATVLELWDTAKNCGIKITQEQLIIRSAEGNEVALYFEDNTNTSAIFVIDRNEMKAKIYLNGVMCGAFNLSDYEASGKWFLEDFSTNSQIKLGGGGYCKVRNLRVYQVALTTDEILNNYISNKLDKDEQKELVAFQNGLHLPTLTIYCDFSGLGKDDKKPCKIVYSSTDEEKYGPSFTLDHKMSTCQYQGTSSMAYPIKNYRINLADESGAKWRYNFPYGQPEYRFTLKADFMSSGHWQNTGLTKWINNNLYHYDENNEKSMNPKKWFDINNGGKLEDTRECIYGFPCRLILINDGNTPLNEGQNEPAPGNTKDMGIFNFNHDKDATDTMGFDQDNFPNCMSFEVTANSDTSAGAFMSFHHHYSIKSNGSDLLGQYLSSTTLKVSDLPPLPWKVKTFDNSLRIMRGAGDATGEVTVQKNSTVTIDTWGGDNVVFRCDDKGRTKNVYFHLNGYECEIDRTGGDNSIELVTDQSDELEYLQQSFEMRFPDPDDYNDWHGYLGLNAGTMVTEYLPVDGGYSTTYWNWDWSQMALGIDSASTLKTIECYYGDEFLANISFNKTNGNARLIDGTNKIRFIFESIPEYFRINDVKYIFGNEVAALDVIDPYLGEEISPEYGLKRLIDWVDNCSDAEFVRDFEQYFHKDYTLRYYLLVITLGMVDNLGKNMMLDSWDGVIWTPRFYDCDTICSYDNTGDIVFDVDIEMEQGYWNTSSSRLWTRIRDLMHPDLVATYKDMRQNGLSFESLMDCFYGEQISKIPQKYYNMDYDVKYAPFGESYMGMAHGDGYEHLKRWLKKRLLFTDTLYDYGPSYEGDILTIRANTTEQMTLIIETYDPVYQHLSWYNGQMDKKKIDKGVAISFSGKAMAATDQEILIYGGSNVKKISGISSTNPSELILGAATRLVELDASNCSILSQINLNKANLAAHTYLRKVNLENCPLLGGSLRINNSPLITDIRIQGTPIDAINFPTSVRDLEFLRIPSTIKSLVLNDAISLRQLEMPGGSTLDALKLKNCNKLTTMYNISLEMVKDVELDNSFINQTHLKFRNSNNIVLKNMPNTQAIVFPAYNARAYNQSELDTAGDIKITTSNCPKLKEFLTTSNGRKGYNAGLYSWDAALQNRFMINTLDLSDTQLETINFFACTDINTLLLPTTLKNFYCDSLMDINETTYPDAEYDRVHNEMVKEFTEADGVIFYKDAVEGVIDDFSVYGYIDASTGEAKYGAPSDYPNATNRVTDFIRVDADYQVLINTNPTNTETLFLYRIAVYDKNYKPIPIGSYMTSGGAYYTVVNNITFTVTQELIDKGVKYVRVYSNWKDLTVKIDRKHMAMVDKDIPGSYGSIIHTMYAPKHNATKPAVGTWRLDGMKLNDFHTYGMNTQVSKHQVRRLNAFQHPTYFAYMTPPIPLTDICYDAGYDIYGQHEDGSRKGVYLFGFDADYNPMTEMNHMFWNRGVITTAEVAAISPSIKYISIYNPEQINGYKMTWNYAGNNTNVITYENYDGYKPTEPGKAWSTTYYDEATIIPRLQGYKVQLREVDISPKDYNTMLYPRLVGVNNNPISGKLDYTDYDGDYLSWAFAYVNQDYVEITQPRLELLPTYKYRYNAFLGTDYSFNDPNEILKYVTSAPDVYPGFNPEYTADKYYTYTSRNEDGTYTTSIYANDINDTPIRVSFMNITELLRVEKMQLSTVNVLSSTFQGCGNLEYADLSLLDTSRVTDMCRMFMDCKKLHTIKGTNTWNTKNVVNNGMVGMYQMFQNCWALTELDLSGWTVRNIDMLCCGCQSLVKINTTNWDTSELTNVGNSNFAYTGVFCDCYALTDVIGIEKWNMSQVTSLRGMFRNCQSLKSIDLTSWDVSNVTNIECMFQGASAIESINLSGWDVRKLTSMYMTFHNCSAVKNINLAGWETNSLTNMQNTFNGCSSLISIDLSNFNMINVETVYGLFYQCKALQSVNINGWSNAIRNKSTGSMFQHCENLVEVKGLADLYTGAVTNMGSMFYNCYLFNNIDALYSWDVSSVTSMANMFQGCYALTEIDLSTWDMSKVQITTSMFNGCSNLTSIILPGKYGEITEPNAMFTGCSRLANLEGIEYLVGNKVTNSINSMFNGCAALTSLDLSTWDVSNVINTQYMFNTCRKLETINLSGWYTPKLKIMYQMFVNCAALTSVPGLSNFITTNVENMESTFQGCSELTSLDLRNWDVSNVTNGNYTFNGMQKLTNLRVDTWPLNDITQKMISTLPVGDDNPNRIFATAKFTVPTGWSLIDPLVIAKFTATSAGVVPIFTPSNFPKTVKETDNGNGTWTVEILRSSIDSYPNQMSFNGFTWVTNIDILDTTNFKSMAQMFSGCTGLVALDVSTWDVSAATNFTQMFARCSNLVSISGMENWDTKSATDMSSMFNYDAKLTSVNVTNLNMSNVTTINSMFYGCNTLTNINVSKWDVGRVTNMNNAFAGCNAVRTLDVSKWNTESATQMQSVFQSCRVVDNIDVSNWDVRKVTTMTGMFNACSAITSIDLSKWIPESLTSLNSMFYSCPLLSSVKIANVNFKSVTSTANMFRGCAALTTIDLSNTNMVLRDVASMFTDCTSLVSVNCDGWVNADLMQGTIMDHNDTWDFIARASALQTDIMYYLSSIYRLTRYDPPLASTNTVVDFTNCDTSQMTSMFLGYSNISEIRGFDNTASEGFSMSFRYIKNSLKMRDAVYFKIGGPYEWAYYGIPGTVGSLDIKFVTIPGSTNYKAETWAEKTNGVAPSNIMKFNDSRWTAESIASFLECLYDYSAEGGSSPTTLTIGSNLNKLTPEQIAVATNKGWTLL